MKKLLIGMLITCSLGLAGCGRNNTENSTTNNGTGTGVTDGTNGTNSNGTGVTDGTGGSNSMNNGNGVTDGTNSNTNGTNNQGSSVSENKTSLNNLYTELKQKVQGGVQNINTEDWDKYSTEFKGKIANLRSTTQDTSMKSTIDDMENLFNQYDTAIRNKTDVAKDKVQELENKIESHLNS